MDEVFLLRTLELLCGIRSVSGKERALALALADHARQRGFRVSTPNVTRNRPNVLIECGTEQGPSLLFSAHLDMQPPPMALQSRPQLIGPTFHGEGVNNMKAALAAMLAAADGLRTARWNGRTILLAAIGEIDSLGRGTTAALHAGLHADAAINGEPTDLRVLLRHAGVARFRITALGRTVHVSQHAQGANAALAIARLVAGLSESVLTHQANDEFPGLPLLNVGVIRGGTHPSLLAGSAFAEVDVRWAPPMTSDSIRADLARYVGGVAMPHGIAIKIDLIGPPHFYAPSAFVSKHDWPVVEAVAEAHQEVVGVPALVGSWMPEVAYGSDAPHLVRAGVMTCMYGPGKGEDVNQEDERIPWKDVITAAKVYERAARKVLQAA